MSIETRHIFWDMPCKKMSKDVSIPTFTIQYLMESGQGLTSNIPDDDSVRLLSQFIERMFLGD